MGLVTSSIIQRVFRIQYLDDSATAFTVEKGNKQLLITVKHLFKKGNYPAKSDIKIFQNGNQVISKKVNLYYHTNTNIDITIIEFIDNTFLSPQHPVNFINQSTYSQEIFFLGFPLNISMSFGNLSVFPFPLVKRGIISAFINENNSSFMFLDGINNPGFSGAPVVTINEDQSINVIGVISGYRYTLDSLVDINSNPISNGEYVIQNTGLIVAYDIRHALDIISLIN